MRKTVWSAVAVMLLVGGAETALGAQRSFVASSGDDTNPCSRTLPCRTFATALLATADAGEIVVLDSAGYGPVAIAQNVSIVAPPGVYAGISVPAGSGVLILGSGIDVTLKGLTINGQGGNIGIDFQIGARLRVENVTVSNFTGAGIRVSAGGSRVLVLDSVVRDTGGNGIDITSAATVTIDRSQLDRNNNGIVARDGARVSLANTVISNSAFSAVNMQALVVVGSSIRVGINGCTLTGIQNEAVYATTFAANSTIDIAVARSSITGNGNGIGLNAAAGGSTVTAAIKDNVIGWNAANGVYVQYPGATAALWGNVLTNNLTGLRILSSGVLKSIGNNIATNNGTDLTGGSVTAVTAY